MTLEAAEDRRWAAAGAVGLCALVAFGLAKFEVTLDVTGFVFGDDIGELARIARRVADGPGSRNLLLVVEGGPVGPFESRLRSDPAVMDKLASLDAGPPSGNEEAVFRLYREHLPGLLAPSSTAARGLSAPDKIEAALGRLETRLRSPASPLFSRLAPEDPLLILPALFERLAEGGPRVEGGRFFTRSGHGLLIAKTRASALDGAAQAELIDRIRGHFAASVPRPAQLHLGGVPKFSAETRRSIRADIARISALSTLALLTLVLSLFRSLRVAFACLLVVGTGFAVGLGASLLVFGRVHGLTLAFGAALIGVSVDYAVHFFVHHAADGGPPRPVLRRLMPGLSLGALTTSVGFVALGTSSLPGLAEVSLFSATGIAGALAGAWLFLPAASARAPFRGSVEIASAALERALAPRRAALIAPLAVVAVAALGLPWLAFDDQLTRLARIDPALVAEESWVRAEVGFSGDGRFLLATGESDGAALEENDRVARFLRESSDSMGFRSISDLLPSPKTQREVAAALGDLGPAIAAAAEARGFSPGAFAPFLARLERPFRPLEYKDLARSPLFGLAESFRIELPGGTIGYLTLLSGAPHPHIEALADQLGPNVRMVDPERIFSGAGERFRRRAALGLTAGACLVIALVALRYRSPKLIALALTPPTGAVFATLGGLGLLGVPLDLIGLTALLMVYSMAVDYGVFLTEATRAGRLGPTLLAVTVAWASTLAGFGLLALSSHPALRGIGLIASLGLTAAVLLVPASLFVARR